MNTVEKIILDALKSVVEDTTTIRDFLKELEPSKCEDGSVGFIAYNVGNKRMKMRIGRFLSRKLKLADFGVKEYIIQTIAGKIMISLHKPIVRFDSGLDIVQNYKNEVGGRSCMTGDMAYCVGMYADNPDRYCQMVMTIAENSARAMIVRLDDGDIYMDRVYSDSLVLSDEMYSYASKKGWHHYKRNPGPMSVSGLFYESGEVPYQDTFARGRIVNGRLNLHTHDGPLSLKMVDGNIGIECAMCCDRFQIEEVYYTPDGDVCEECYFEYYGVCCGCGEVGNREDLFLVDGDTYYCEDCVPNNAEECRECGSFCSRDIRPTRDGVVCFVCGYKYSQCAVCGYFAPDEEIEPDGLCDVCGQEWVKCPSCGIYHKGDDICADCATDIMTGVKK